MIRTFALASSVLVLLMCTASLKAADDNQTNPPSTPTSSPGEKKAQDKSNGKDKFSALFDKLDANHDGQITADEVPDEQRRLFERLLRRADKNGDSKLSREEFISGMTEMEEHGERPADRANAAGERPSEGRAFGFGGFGGGPGGGGPAGGAFGGGAGGGGPLMGMALFHALDTNGDGKLDAKEIAAAPEVLKKLANANGEITRDELMKSMPGALAGGFGGGGRFAGFAAGSTGGGLAGGAGQGELNPDAIAKRFIQKFDKNGDGKLQKDELPHGLQQRFDELDTNHDGALDESELKAILPRLMRRLQEEQGPGGAGVSERQHRAKSDSNAPTVKTPDDKMPADSNSIESKPADSKSDSN
jgi:Ca2+-binding EF-hand superfamily protein